MKNKGQITIFVLVAIVIVVGIVGYFVFSGDVLERDKPEDITISISSYGEGCLKDSIRDVIYFNGLQGGYFIPGNDSLEYGFLEIPYYWSYGENQMPPLSSFQEGLKEGIEFTFLECVNGFNEFESRYDSLEVSEIDKTEIIIKDGVISVKIDMPIFTRKGNFTEEIKDFSGSYNFDLIEKYEILLEAMELQALTPKSPPLIQFTDLAYENNFTFEIIELEDLSRDFLNVFVFNDAEYYNAEEAQYTFIFATRYNEEDLDEI